VVTHAHPEAAVGAITVALAAALATLGVRAADLIPAVLEYTPDGEVATGLRRATRLRFALDPRHVADTLAEDLGCGHCALRAVVCCPSSRRFTEALWATVSAGGAWAPPAPSSAVSCPPAPVSTINRSGRCEPIPPFDCQPQTPSRT
jgi:ADP-ribosylglycohydrolase